MVQYEALFSGDALDGRFWLVLINVGRGPALRIEVEVLYDHPNDPTPVGAFTIPVLMPGEREEFDIAVHLPLLEEVRGDAFRVSGSYLDREQAHEYEIVTDWGSPPMRRSRA